MTRSLRAAFPIAVALASMLAASGCQDGGGGGNHDSGVNPSDAVTGQHDVGQTQPDAPASCGHTSGAAAKGGLCANDNACTCPNDCQTMPSISTAGSCWPTCTATVGCTGTAQCVGLDPNASEGACLEKGTLSGTFDALVVNPTGSITPGTANVTLSVGSISKTFTLAVAVAVAASGNTPATIQVQMFPSASDTSHVLVVIFKQDANYANGHTYDLSAGTNDSGLTYEETVGTTSQTARALPTAAVINVTTAGKALGEHVTGTISNGVMVEFSAELCGGPNTAACPS
jgi:hypothetical protein